MRLKELHLHNNKLGYEGVEKLCAELAKFDVIGALSDTTVLLEAVLEDHRLSLIHI